MKKYFATYEDKELHNKLKSKLQSYREYLHTSGMFRVLEKSYRTYYGSPIINEDSGLVNVQINHYANLIRHVNTMVTSTRPAFECRAVNSDSESQSQALLGNGLLDYYLRESKLEELMKSAAELSLVLKEGWIFLDWDPKKGENYAVNLEGSPIKTGDISSEVFSMLEVARDVHNHANQDWFIITKRVNKFDLIASFPHLSDDILKCSLQNERYSVNLDKQQNIYANKEDSDLIEVHTFLHSKTPACPNGKYTMFVDSTILLDGDLPYEKPHLYKISSSKKYQSAFGSSIADDLLPVQDLIDSTISIIATNQSQYGVQNITARRGSNINIQDMGPLQLIEYTDVPPAPLNLVQTPPEIFNFSNMLTQIAETLSGVSNITRGQAPASLSGAAMALVASQSLQFSSGLQSSYNSLLEQVGSGIFSLLKEFAVAPRIAMIAGKSKRSYVKEFSKDSIQKISNVVVDSANPLTKTTAGRVEIANTLLQTGLIKNAENYLQVISTGTLEPLTESSTSQNVLIRRENEWLTEGQIPQAIMTDNHETHILEHAAVLNSPESRENPKVVEAVLSHIQTHVEMSKNRDSFLTQLLKQTPAPVPAPTQVVNPELMQQPQEELPQPAQPPLNPITNQPF